MNFLIAFGIIAFGVVVIVYTVQVVKLFGRMDWAERWFGPTGTYTAWKIIGLICIVGSVVFFQYL